MSHINRFLSGSWIRMLVLFGAFYAVSLHLAYAPLSRYSIREHEGLKDSLDYLHLVTASVPRNADNHRLLRPLLSYTAKPIYWILRARLPEGRAAEIALIVTLCGFAALTSLGIVVLVRIAGAHPGGDRLGVGVVAGLLYVGSFWNVNHYIPGLIDGGEACAMAWLMVALHAGKPGAWALSAIIILGTLAKETFLIFAGLAVLTHWICLRRRPSPAVFLAASIGLAVGLSLILALRWYSYGSFISPMKMVADFERASDTTFMGELIRHTRHPAFWFGVVWMLPAAILKRRAVPSSVIIPCTAPAVLALLLGAYHSAGPGNVARPIFSLLAPWICWGAAALLVSMSTRDSSASLSPSTHR